MWVFSIVTLGLALLLADVAPIASPSPSPGPTGSALPAPTASPTDLAKSRLETMFRTGHADGAWFSASFLAQVPVSKVDEGIAGLTNYFGEYKSVEFAPGKIVAHFAKGTADVAIHFDSNSKIDQLRIFNPVLSTTASPGTLGTGRQPTGMPHFH